MHSIAVVDLETSGLDPWHHDIIEVGYVLDGEDGYSEVEFSMPFNPANANEKALEVNGWGQREFAPQITEVEGARQMAADFDGRFIVASPAHFDIGFIQAHLTKYSVSPTWGHRSIIDLKSLVCGSLGILDKLGNRDIAAHFQVSENTAKHTALADAVWTYNMLMALELWGTR